VLATKDLAVGYDRPLFYCPDVEVRRGDRVALIGPNGAGKTTFLKTVLGEIPAFKGRIRLGASVEPGYLAQAQAGLDPDDTVLDAILEIRNLPLTQARSFLGQYLFIGEDVFRTIGTLSGGQRSRVALARLTLHGANFLLLDEPTNHLDLDTQEILEAVLKGFPGTVLLVTHDRWLVQGLATQVWRVDGNEMLAYQGNYEEYLKQRALETEGALPGGNGNDVPAERAQAEADRERAREERRQRKAAEKRAEQAAAMEARIHELEARLSALSNQLEASSIAGDVTKVHRLGVEYQQTDAELHRVMAEWAELA
jgi:ATP-binding cassette, subfamily F, member 3